jgi:hypothetical protein
MSTDYIPRSDGKFNSWQENLISKVNAAAGRLGIPEAVITTTYTKKARWDAAYKQAEDPSTRTKAAVVEKNEAREDYDAHLRNLNNAYLIHNPAMTDVDREQMNLPIHKTTHTPAPVAETHPAFYIDSSMLRCLIIHFHDQGKKKSKAKPPGQRGAEIRWMISDTPMVDANELIHSSFDTRTPFTLEFPGHDRGKTVYLCLRWENTRGQKGPWSEIKDAIIP